MAPDPTEKPPPIAQACARRSSRPLQELFNLLRSYAFECVQGAFCKGRTAIPHTAERQDMPMYAVQRYC